MSTAIAAKATAHITMKANDCMRFGGKRISILAESVELCLRLGRYVSLPIVPIMASVAAILSFVSRFVSAPQRSRNPALRRKVSDAVRRTPRKRGHGYSGSEHSCVRAEQFHWQAFSIDKGAVSN